VERSGRVEKIGEIGDGFENLLQVRGEVVTYGNTSE